MKNPKNSLLNDVAEYYSEKLAKHGETPRGVDWNGEESQVLRFQQLSKIITPLEKFSINDLGSGYGAFFSFLIERYPMCSYLGIDISREMIDAAEQRFKRCPQARFIKAAEPDQVADFGVASGIFNVRLGYNDIEWRDHMFKTLDLLNNTSRLGFSFNCLTSYSDEDKKKDHLYYADPCFLFDACKKKYSRQIALLHDYGLYEFTILVRKY